MKLQVIIIALNCVFNLSFCADDSREFITIDGIKVQIKDKSNALETPEKAKKKIKETESSQDKKEDFYEDPLTEEDLEEDDEETTRHLPTPCHVCRLLVAEVEDGLAKFGDVRKERVNKPPIYWKEERVMLLAIEDLCVRMRKYNVRRSHPFRYKKGVKSTFRREVEELTSASKIPKFVWLTPEENLDDPTGEIGRLEKKCKKMLVAEQHMLVHWFMKEQSRDLTTWLCANRVLIGEDQALLPRVFHQTPP
ncbi:protein canopy homolog 4 isoform X2 [Nematostella vectensis]|uniref:protein canopy homolog 4 isoform X2 n=1 Tax=Nematostella vectensis TaxID=45351 RepID=UPI002076ECA0|nr:protein canopy homolog 4 isoform X2 [Nematostella vectensis]